MLLEGEHVKVICLVGGHLLTVGEHTQNRDALNIISSAIHYKALYILNQGQHFFKEEKENLLSNTTHMNLITLKCVCTSVFLKYNKTNKSQQVLLYDLKEGID